MKAPKTASWVIGTALLSVLILALAWVFGVSPQLAQADQARADADVRRAQNEGLQRKLDELREQAAHLEDYEAELAAIARQIPLEDAEPDFIREVDAAAQATGVFVVSAVAENPETAFIDYDAEAQAADGAAATPAPATGDAAEGGEAQAPVEPAPVGPQPVHIPGFVAVPFTITVLAPFENTVAFMERMQTGLQRLFVVTGFDVAGQKETPASGGRPETHEGDAEFAITGYVYVLQEDVDDAGTGQAAAPGGTVDT